MKHLLLALVWIGVNCAVLRFLLKSSVAWHEFPVEVVLVNVAAFSVLFESHALRRVVWFLVFVLLILFLFVRLAAITSYDSRDKPIYRDTANLIEPPKPIGS